MLSAAHFDAEKFIAEVEIRPALWDTDCEEYKRLTDRKMYWEQLIDIYKTKDVVTQLQRDEIGQTLQKKWKSLRDAYRREVTRRKNGHIENQPFTYVYFKQLQFLDKNSKMDSNKSNSMEDIEDQYSSTDEDENKFSPNSSDAADKKIIALLSQGVKQKADRSRSEEDDHERMFLLSLVNDLKRVPQAQRLSVKIEIMNIIKHAIIDKKK